MTTADNGSVLLYFTFAEMSMATWLFLCPDDPDAPGERIHRRGGMLHQADIRRDQREAADLQPVFRPEDHVEGSGRQRKEKRPESRRLSDLLERYFFTKLLYAEAASFHDAASWRPATKLL